MGIEEVETEKYLEELWGKREQWIKMTAGGEVETKDILFREWELLRQGVLADGNDGNDPVAKKYWGGRGTFPWLPRAIGRAWVSALGPCLLGLWGLFHWNIAYPGLFTNRSHLGFSLWKITSLAPSFHMNIKTVKSWTTAHTAWIPSLTNALHKGFSPSALSSDKR